LWPCRIKEEILFWCILLYIYIYIYIYIYMIGVYLCVIFLAHPICLCLAMIMYAVHVSIWYCRRSWWGLGSERGLDWEFWWFVFWIIICKHCGYLLYFVFINYGILDFS